MAEFLDELVDIAKEVDPECLCTLGNYPPTEFLRPQNLDFVCFNVYLHQPRPFENYLARLQMIADNKPLILGEFGIDTIEGGRTVKCEILDWQIETVFAAGWPEQSFTVSPTIGLKMIARLRTGDSD